MNESKSQQFNSDMKTIKVVTNIRISMNESKSQLYLSVRPQVICCYKYQNINERKQITTIFGSEYVVDCCYKYQNINERKQITTVAYPLTPRYQLLQISEYQ